MLRSAGGNLRESEREVSYAVAHAHFGMAHVSAKRDRFVRGLAERGGRAEAATARLRRLYPALLVAPLLDTVEDDRLAQAVE